MITANPTDQQLKHKILAAQARGDVRELARLQAQFRMRAVTTSTDRGYRLSPPRLVGSPVGRPPARLLLARAAAVQAWPRVSIKEYVRSNFEPYDGHERAGWLIGEVVDDEIFIVDVVSCGEDDATGSTVRMPPADAARTMLDLPLNLTVVGDVHGHAPDMNSEPSARDIAAWTHVMDWLSRDLWLGLVAREVKGQFGWHMDLNATLLRREHGRVTHCSVPITTRSY